MSIKDRILKIFRWPQDVASSYTEKAIIKRVDRLGRIVKRHFDSLENKVNRRFDSLENKVNRRFSEVSREMRRQERTNYEQLTQYMELRRLFDNDQVMPKLRGYAISPDLVFYLLDLLERYKPQSILEFGSGFSSIVFSRYANSAGAKVVSVDHEPFFAKKSGAAVSAWGYANHFNLITTDVVEQEVDGQKVIFYDRSALEKHFGFDFVFLDGPPQKLGITVRGGLLPLFRPLLSPGCIIVLDDYYRAGEREVVANWLKAGLVEVIEENEFIEKHAAVLRVI